MPWALITGATSGIGRATVEAMRASGFDVIATGRHIKDEPSGTSDGRRRLYALPLDVTSASSIAQCAREVAAITEGHGIDVLVNNAGYSHAGPVELISDEDLTTQFATNVFGAVAIARALLPRMRERGAGRIINVDSPMGRMTIPLHGAYSASKAALRSLSAVLRMEVAPFGVDVVLVEPGVVQTKFAETAVAHAQSQRGGGTPYEPALADFQHLYARLYRNGVKPEAVADTIVRAARAERPSAHYIGLRPRSRVTFLALLPTAVGDALKRRAIGYRVGQNAL